MSNVSGTLWSKFEIRMKIDERDGRKEKIDKLGGSRVDLSLIRMGLVSC